MSHYNFHDFFFDFLRIFANCCAKLFIFAAKIQKVVVCQMRLFEENFPHGEFVV